jgi:hypothetical protein
LYFRFALSFRDVKELLAMRGVALSYETVREWCLKFGQAYANGLRRRSPRPGDQWHLDEVFLKINRRFHYLWRADHRVILSSGETSVQGSWLSRSDEDKIRRLGRGDRRPASCLKKRAPSIDNPNKARIHLVG